MPGGNGRSQGGMNRKNHHDSLSQSGQQRYGGGGGGTRQPKWTPPRQRSAGDIVDSYLFGTGSKKKGKKR